MEMAEASHACIEICKQYGTLNDLMIWLNYKYFVLASITLRERSHHIYGQFGELASYIHALGQHKLYIRSVKACGTRSPVSSTAAGNPGIRVQEVCNGLGSFTAPNTLYLKHCVKVFQMDDQASNGRARVYRRRRSSQQSPITRSFASSRPEFGSSIHALGDPGGDEVLDETLDSPSDGQMADGLQAGPHGSDRVEEFPYPTAIPMDHENNLEEEALPSVVGFGTSEEFLAWLEDLGLEATAPELLVNEHGL
ncbi:hypothetical protein BBP40_010396 [Aspergillus hancockii]|nr:hypothetical protein BBP40_010396 [Aspergillus hancockii]